MTCCNCTRSNQSARLPHGWKRIEARVYCESCWRERYVLRSVTMPVVEPVGRDWGDLREALKQGWVLATAAANWMMTELYTRDIRRSGEERMPRMQRQYLYPEARERFPQLAPQTVVSLEQRVQAAYRTARYPVIWTGSASLPTYRYPLPLPVHNQSWEATLAHDQPVIRVRLGDGWWELRLKGGPRFRRQILAYGQMASGEAVRGELALYRIRAQMGKLSDRPHSDQVVKYALMCKMVAWLPRPDASASAPCSGTLRVRTGDQELLVASTLREEPVWRYHGDHLRRWAAAYRKFLQNLAEDQKAEQRRVPRFADRRTAAAEKYGNRMRSAVREIAAQLAAFAERRGFQAMEFDDTATDFCPEFPYAALRLQVRAKCEALELQFTHTAAPVEGGRAENETASGLESKAGPPAGPARRPANTLADLTGRGRL